MHLFLVRHGETVDNVAGLYAGSRDSTLTNHGVLQARRLASHLAKTPVKHLFSSNLRRAVDTAEAVRDAQKCAELKLVQLAELREKHFGTGEGVKYGMGTKTVYEGAETAEAMKARVDCFLDDHLLPLLDGSESPGACVVIAHGIILGVIFRALSLRFKADAVSVASTLKAGSFSSTGLHPTWSNTGYLEAILTKRAVDPPSQDEISFTHWKLHVIAVNATVHLEGLKKTRGGIGSAKFDNKQRTMDSFFKPASRKRKLENEDG